MNVHLSPCNGLFYPRSVFSLGKEWAGPFFPREKTDCGKFRPVTPVPSKMYKLACAPMEDTDQPGHPNSLIMGSQGSVSSGRNQLYHYCVVGQTDFNLHCTHMPNTYAEYRLGLYLHATSTNIYIFKAIL